MGKAQFTDDLPEPPHLLHAVLALSTKTHARLLGLNLDWLRKQPGIVAVLGPDDIPGRNDVSTSQRANEPLFATGTIQHWGQALAVIVGETRDLAAAAAAGIVATVEELEPVLSIEKALSAGDLLLDPIVMQVGDIEASLSKAPATCSGDFSCGGQEHFYLEGQICVAVPGEDGDLVLYSSTQHPTEVQHMASRVIGCDFNQITVQVRRMGGAFGGKESNASWIAAAAALCAHKTGHPVKLRLSRKIDMAVTGKRHPFLFRWRAGFDDSGRILAVDALLAADGGHVLDLSAGVIFRAVTHALNVLDIPVLRIEGRVVRTNTVSNTAFRGYGGPQGVLLAEEIVRHVAQALGRTPEFIREVNMLGGNNGELTPYGQKIEGDLIRRVWQEAETLSAWTERRSAIDAFNARHRFKRRGLGSFVLAFGIGFGVQHMNQAGALVHVYADGSVRVNHGGTEMGQGLFIKVAQIVADVFAVPVSVVKITATNTAEVPNTSPTAASTGTDLNGWAAKNAATTIRDRMVECLKDIWECDATDIEFVDGEVRSGNRRLTFGEIAKMCHVNRVQLSAAGFYKTPGLHWDSIKMRGEPFFYFSYAASVAEVEIDTLTGEFVCTGAWLVEDCGQSLNPAIDLGQIEGAFVQGLGWLTCEELWWDQQGRLKTIGPSTYKIPGSRDVPETFEVRLLEGAPARADTVFRSKAVGEPPLMLATAAWNALADATGATTLNAPATPERILEAWKRREESRRT
jgi:xanthine dehydrogenase large subunit